MGSNQLFPSADETSFFIGAYSGKDVKGFNVANPTTPDAKWPKWTPVLAYETKDPSTVGVGSLGDAVYYN